MNISLASLKNLKDKTSRATLETLKHKTSRAALKNLRHKTWKGTLLRIGLTESQPEDPEFKHLLATVDEIKPKLREMYIASLAVAEKGKEFNNDLIKFCGLGFKSEEVFNKEVEFLSYFEVQFCSALRRLVNTDINTLDDLIVEYKSAKLRFDSLHFKTIKKMKKNGINVTVKEADDVMRADADLPALYEAYVGAKLAVSSQRDEILRTLKTMAESMLIDLSELSGARHHQLYCRYFKKRFENLAEICETEASKEEISVLARGNTFSNHRSRPSSMFYRSGSGTLPGYKAMNVTSNKAAKPLSAKKIGGTEDDQSAELEVKNNLIASTAADDKDVQAINVESKHPQNPEMV